MDKTKQGWKVFSTTPSRDVFKSCGVPIKYSLAYIRGVPRVPNDGCGPMCLFSKKSQAERYIRKRLPYGHKSSEFYFRILKCEYLPSMENNVWTNEMIRSHITILPAGTILADKIKIMEEQ